MCGICGIFEFRAGTDKETVTRRMMSVMKHRGPDDEGVWSDKKISMGFVRLSIIDLNHSANQPMTDDESRYVITFNGEIYNYIEIREKLISKGHRFKTGSDTEVLLKAYAEWGKESFSMFNGMFAFAIYDRYSGKLILVRDRYGVKPLYYFFDSEKFIYASEIQPILDAYPELRETNDEAVFNYLVFNRTDYDETTFFRRIKKLRQGHYAEIETTAGFRQWYNLKQRLGENDGKGSLIELLESSVKLRLRSDVPVGVCLSGGLDSSTIMSILTRKFGRRDINSFSAVYGGSFEHDESRFINEYRDEISDMHFITPDHDTLFNDMEDFVNAHGEPIPSTSPYAQYKVMEIAKKKVKVTLDGQGADEELAGYHYFFGNYFKELLLRFRFITLAAEMISYRRRHHSLYAYKTFLYFLLPAYLKTRLRSRKAGYISEGFYSEYKSGNKIAGELYSSGSLNEALLRHFEMKLEHLLKWEDRNSMHFSLEARLPFLDYRVVEHCLSLPSKEIIRQGMTKHILRRQTAGLLPESIRDRTDKTGFDTPEDEWFRKENFREFISDVINSESFRGMGYVNPDMASVLYKMHLDRKINISKDIWKWINLYLWKNKFIG